MPSASAVSARRAYTRAVNATLTIAVEQQLIRDRPSVLTWTNLRWCYAGGMAIRVLFLCTGNSARSIMAEALLKKLGGDVFDVRSAGTEPRGINPYTVRTLEEAHIDLGDAQSKHLDQFVGQTFDYVITVCDRAAERCPVFPHDPQRIHWSFADPAMAAGTDEEKVSAFRRTLVEMRTRLSTFILAAERRKARTT